MKESMRKESSKGKSFHPFSLRSSEVGFPLTAGFLFDACAIVFRRANKEGPRLITMAEET